MGKKVLVATLLSVILLAGCRGDDEYVVGQNFETTKASVTAETKVNFNVATQAETTAESQTTQATQTAQAEKAPSIWPSVLGILIIIVILMGILAMARKRREE